MSVMFVLILSVLLGFNSFAVNGITSTTLDGYNFTTSVSTANPSYTDVKELATSSYHAQGTTNVYSTSSQYTETHSADLHFVHDYNDNGTGYDEDAIFRSQAISLGVSESRSIIIAQNTSWAVTSSKPSGYYCLAARFQISTVTYSAWEYEDDEWSPIGNHPIYYVPDTSPTITLVAVAR